MSHTGSDPAIYATVTDATTVIDHAIAGLRAANDGPTLLGTPTTLTATVTGGTHVSYTWDFGDEVGPTRAYTSPGSMNLAIPDNGCGSSTYLEHAIQVPMWATILDLDVILDDLRHTFDDDINLYLRAPDGTQVALSTGNGGTGDDYYNTVFDDEASAAITEGAPPFTGRFRPEEALAAFDGLNQQGGWTLRICDGGGSAEGVLNAWHLTITSTTPSANGVITHTYTATGTYSAQVTAGNSAGTVTATTTLTVTAPITTSPGPTYTLTVHTVGQGTVTLDPPGGVYDAHTSVTLTATPTTGWHFAGWRGALNSANAHETLVMNDHKEVTATFSTTPPMTHTLTVAVVGQGTVTPTAGTHTYVSGTVVTLAAAPDPGWQFAGWRGDLNSATARESLVMNDHKQVTATFSTTPPMTHTLTVAVVGQGTVTPTAGTHTYVSGTVVTLAADPDSGWQFAGWHGALSGAASPSDLTIDADKVVTATFTAVSIPTHTLTVAMVGQGTVTPTAGTHAYVSGTVVTLAAEPAPDWRFAGWGGALSGTTSPVTLTLDADKAVTATFTPTGCVAVTDVAISGPVSGYTATVYTFTSSITPTDATHPMTFTWFPPPLSGQGTLTATYRWAMTGTKTLTLTAENCGGAVHAEHTLLISTPHALPPGDPATGYEPNDACADAKAIATDGVPQRHVFLDDGDEDWAGFQASEGVTYIIEVRVPPTSTVDVGLEVRDTCAPGNGQFPENPIVPDIRLTFVAPSSGIYYIRLFNHDTHYGADAVYYLSVRTPAQMQRAGAVIVVAGRYEEDDPLQANINTVASAVYNFAYTHGCTSDAIHYLSTATGDPGVDALTTWANLRDAIVQWAPAKVDAAHTLSIFMMDHGGADKFYLDAPGNQILTPLDLDSWLDELEAQVPNLGINLVIEACHSGSFIDLARTVSAPNRVVIASTGADRGAYASMNGAVFSDNFVAALKQGLSVRQAFEEGRWATTQRHIVQTPWLDDNGDSQPNTGADGQRAALQSFACQPASPDDRHPPHVDQVEIRDLQGKEGTVWARALDDTGVKDVYAIIYRPSDWVAGSGTGSGDVLRTEPTALPLLKAGEDYASLYTRFDQIGQYQVNVYATDSDGLLSRVHQKTFWITRGGHPIEANTATSATFIHTAPYTTHVQIPAGAFTEATVLTYTVHPTASDVPPGLAFGQRAFGLTIYQRGQRITETVMLAHPLTLTLHYGDDEMADLDETTLTLWWWDGNTWSQSGLRRVMRLTEANTLIVTTDHLSTFALFGQALAASNPRVYLPLVLRQ